MVFYPKDKLRALARKGKNPAFCMNREIKCNCGSVIPSAGSVGDHGEKPVKHIQYLV